MQTFLILGAILNGILVLTTGVFAFLKNRRGAISRTFAVLCFCLGAWALGYVAADKWELPLLVPYAGASFLAVANFHFITTLLGRHKTALIIIGYLFNLILLTYLTVQFSVPSLPLDKWVSLDPIYNTWLAVWLLYLLYPILILMHACRELSGVKKYQLKFLLLEYVIALLLGAAVLFSFYNPLIPLYANLLNSTHLLSALHVFLVFYLFVEYKFLNLKLLVPVFLKKSIALIAVAILGGLLYQPTTLLLVGFTPLYINILIATFIILAYNAILYVLDYYNFFKATSLEQFREVTSQFKTQNTFYESAKELESDIQAKFCEKLAIESARIILLKSDTAYPKIQNWFSQHSGFLVTDEEEYLQSHNHISCEYLDELKSLGDICYPLYKNTDKLIGFFVLKKKISDDIYIEEELKLLESVVHYIALSLVNIIYTDELRKQTQQLQESYNRLKKLDEAKDSFISVTSHELRTPATIIRGYTDMLLSGKFGDLTDQQKNFSHKILGSTNNLLSIINNILDITKLEAGNMEFKFSKVNVEEVVEDAMLEFKETCAKKCIALSCSIRPEGRQYQVYTDPKRLKRILRGLVENACKFTPEDPKKDNRIEINVEKYKQDPNFLKLEVSDTGPGIKQEAQKRIFEKFGQVENFLQKTYTGTGLGLSIVNRILEKLGGKIWLNSEPNKGSTFTFLIPLTHE
ncbi:MAG: HAMP domain-containing sensor histidine kinase [Patescibacteria group bacterium]